MDKRKFVEEYFRKDSNERWLESSEDIKIIEDEVEEEKCKVEVTKTEVQEESHDFEVKENVTKSLDLQETVRQDYDVWLSDDDIEVIENDLEIYVSDEKDSEESRCKCNMCGLAFGEQLYLENHYKCHQENSVFSQEERRNEEPHSEQSEKEYLLFNNNSNGNSDVGATPRSNEYSGTENRKHCLKDSWQSRQKPLKCTYKNCKCMQLQPLAKEVCECTPCKFVCIYKSALQRHILAKHSNDGKKIKCNRRNVATHIKRNLVFHTGIHLRETSFRCGMCDNVSTQKILLKNHILMKHRKRHKCTKCKYFTYVKQQLMLHLCTHLKENC